MDYTWSSKSNRKHNEFEYNFLIICRYLNLVKNKRKVVTFIFFLINYGNFVIFLENFVLKGNNSNLASKSECANS